MVTTCDIISTKGFTCTASSEYNRDHPCSKVYDSNTGSSWATKNEGVGAWIDIQLPKYAQLSKIETRNRYRGRRSGKNFKDITLSFSDGTSQTANIKDGTDPEWNVIAIDPSVKTMSIRISVTGVHGAHVLNPGFSEIRFYSCKGMS